MKTLILILFLIVAGWPTANAKPLDDRVRQFMTSYLDAVVRGDPPRDKMERDFVSGPLENDREDFRRCKGKKCAIRLREPAKEGPGAGEIQVHLDVFQGDVRIVQRSGCYVLQDKSSGPVILDYIYDCHEK